MEKLQEDFALKNESEEEIALKTPANKLRDEKKKQIIKAYNLPEWKKSASFTDSSHT